MEMIDDTKRLLWREALGEQMRSQISSLSLSHSLFPVPVSVISPFFLLYTQTQCNTHKQRVAKHFYHIFPFHLYESVTERGKKKSSREKKQTNQKEEFIRKDLWSLGRYELGEWTFLNG